MMTKEIKQERVTPRTSQQFIIRPDNHQVQAEPEEDPTQVPAEQAGKVLVQNHTCNLYGRPNVYCKYALTGNDTFWTVETPVSLQTAVNNVVITLF